MSSFFVMFNLLNQYQSFNYKKVGLDLFLGRFFLLVEALVAQKQATDPTFSALGECTRIVIWV